jgi:hypothetical protein
MLHLNQKKKTLRKIKKKTKSFEKDKPPTKPLIRTQSLPTKPFIKSSTTKLVTCAQKDKGNKVVEATTKKTQIKEVVEQSEDSEDEPKIGTNKFWIFWGKGMADVEVTCRRRWSKKSTRWKNTRR